MHLWNHWWKIIHITLKSEIKIWYCSLVCIIKWVLLFEHEDYKQASVGYLKDNGAKIFRVFLGSGLLYICLLWAGRFMDQCGPSSGSWVKRGSENSSLPRPRHHFSHPSPNLRSAPLAFPRTAELPVSVRTLVCSCSVTDPNRILFVSEGKQSDQCMWACVRGLLGFVYRREKSVQGRRWINSLTDHLLRLRQDQARFKGGKRK